MALGPGCVYVYAPPPVPPRRISPPPPTLTATQTQGPGTRSRLARSPGPRLRCAIQFNVELTRAQRAPKPVYKHNVLQYKHHHSQYKHNVLHYKRHHSQCKRNVLQYKHNKMQDFEIQAASFATIFGGAGRGLGPGPGARNRKWGQLSKVWKHVGDRAQNEND